MILLIKKLEHNNCYLAVIDLSAADEVAAWSNDIEMSLKTGDISDMINLETQKTYLENMNNSTRYGFYIVDKKSNQVIGIARLMRINWINRNAVMGIFIGDKKNRKSGFGTEASEMILDFAFNILNLRNVMTEVFSFNEGSSSLCKKIGMKEIGRRRKAIIYGKHEYDEVYFDILDEEFEKTSIIKFD